MEWKEYLRQINKLYAEAPETAVKECEKITANVISEYGAGSAEHAGIMNETAAVLKGLGRLAEAELSFREALVMFERHYGRESVSYATCLINLAGTHRLMGDTDKAETEFKDSADLIEAVCGRAHILYAAALNNLSLVYLDKNMLSEAAEFQEQASEILKGLPEKKRELQSSLSNLGELYRRLGSYERSEECLLKAISMLENELGTNTPHYHETINSLGVLYFTLGEYKKAQEQFLRAAGVAEKMYGREHYETKAAYEHAALAESKMKEQGESTL